MKKSSHNSIMAAFFSHHHLTEGQWSRRHGTAADPLDRTRCHHCGVRHRDGGRAVPQQCRDPESGCAHERHDGLCRARADLLPSHDQQRRRHSFTNITIARLTSNPINDNGSYAILSVASQELVLSGRGKHLVESDRVELRCTVTSTDYSFETIH